MTASTKKYTTITFAQQFTICVWLPKAFERVLYNVRVVSGVSSDCSCSSLTGPAQSYTSCDLDSSRSDASCPLGVIMLYLAEDEPGVVVTNQVESVQMNAER